MDTCTGLVSSLVFYFHSLLELRSCLNATDGEIGKEANSLSTYRECTFDSNRSSNLL
jgi:hypothetical protein